MVTKNISMRFQHSPIKTVGGVRKSTKKCTKMTSLSPVPVEPLFGRPRDLCPDITFSKMHKHERLREDRSSGKWSKRQTDRHVEGHRVIVQYICGWLQIKQLENSLLTPLAGKARNITGVTPLYRAKIPSLAISSLKTSRTPFGYIPSGATQKIK